MTLSELLRELNNTYGMCRPWPKSKVVDADTYGHVVHEIISATAQGGQVTLYLGPRKGVLFRGVELVLDNKESK